MKTTIPSFAHRLPMKYSLLILLFVMNLVAVCSGEVTKGFAIFLTADEVSYETLSRGTNDCSGIRLAATPILTNKDIVFVV